MNRGDVVLAFYPFASGSGGTRRPGSDVISALEAMSVVLEMLITNMQSAELTTDARTPFIEKHEGLYLKSCSSPVNGTARTMTCP